MRISNQSFMMWSYKHPGRVIILLLGITLFFACHILAVPREMSARMLWVKDDPAISLYKKTLETFGLKKITVIFVKDSQLFTPEMLGMLSKFQRALENIPYVDRVDSLFSNANLQGRKNVLYTYPFVNDVPVTLKDAEAIKAESLRNPLAVKKLVSRDGSVIAFNLILDESVSSDQEKLFSIHADEAMAAISPYVEKIFQFGSPYIFRMLHQAQKSDQVRIIPLAFLLFTLISFVIWRSFSLAGLIVISSCLSILWTLGFMGMFGLSLNSFTIVIPALLVAIGSTEDTHLFAKYLTGIRKTGKRTAAIPYMIEKSSLPLFLTGLTTFLGFLAIAFNKIALLQQFGIICAFGLFANPVITFLIAPVYLRYFGPKQAGGAASGSIHTLFSRLASAIVYLIRAYRWQTLSVLTAGILLMGIFAFKIKVDIDVIRFFKPSSPIREFDRLLDEKLAGKRAFIIHIRGKSLETFHEPENLARLAEIQNSLRQSGWCDLATSIVDYLMLLHREMHSGDKDYYSIPDSPDLIAQYLLIMPRDKIASFITNDAREVSILVRHNVNSSHALEDLIAKTTAMVGRHLSAEFDYHVTGASILNMKGSHALVTGQVLSLSFTLIVVFLLLSILFADVRIGLLSLIPNSLPIILLFGVMGLSGISLNPGSAMVAAIAIGIAVDDTIHFIACYRMEMRRLQDQDKALEACIHSEIRPIIATSLGMISGFAVLMMSTLVPIVHFGFLSATVMLFALITDLFITPVLLSSKRLYFAAVSQNSGTR